MLIRQNLRSATVLLLLLAVGCGSSVSDGEEVSPTPSPQPSPTAQATSDRLDANEQATDRTDAGDLVKAESVAGVSLRTDRQSYHQGDPIEVTVANGGDRDVFALSGQTYCTILTVERRVEGGWRLEAPCLQGGPPTFVRLAAGTRITVEVGPLYPAEPELPPGEYRIRVHFLIGSTSGPSETAISAGFVITS